jgi:hypothetical protein
MKMAKLSAMQKETVVITVINKMNSLSTQRNEWQVQYDRTNTALYALLAECLNIYNEIKGTTAEKEVIAQIKEHLAQRKMQVKAGTSVINLIVRYVFNSDRRRISSYARVLSVAIKEAITVKEFSGWVNAFGGIEEVARVKGATLETQQKNFELENQITVVHEFLDLSLEDPLSIVPRTALNDIAGSGEFTLLIGKTLGNGDTQVLSIVPDTTQAMIDMAIKKIAKGLISLTAQEESSVKQQVRDEAVEKARLAARPIGSLKISSRKRPAVLSSKKVKVAA